MNAIDRIELAIRRAASQMPTKELQTAFKLVGDEMALMTHDFMNANDAANCKTALNDYRKGE